jgi:hypothetical protein
MTWFDGFLLLLVIGVVMFEARQESGRGLLDAVATLAAVHFSGQFAPMLTLAMKWKPFPGTEVSPLAQLACFAGFLTVGLFASRTLHKQLRWSMDQFDLVFGVAFGLVVAVSLGHVFTDFAARMAILKYGGVPDCLRNSMLADELRSFRSYNYVLSVFHSYQDGRGVQ